MFAKPTSVLLSTFVGLLGLGNAITNIYALNINPTIEDIVSVIAHTDPYTRSLGGPEPILTNAERFAQGLPPAKPASIRRARLVRPYGDARLARREGGASVVPMLPVKGAIRVTDQGAGTPLGFLSRVVNQFGEYSTTTPLAVDPNALQVIIPGDIFLNGGSFFNLASPNTASGFPLVGATVGFANSDDNLVDGSYNYLYFTEVNASPAQTPGRSPGNSFNTATAFTENSQSAIWNYDSVTQALTMTWTNANNNPQFVVNPQAVLVSDTLAWAGDVSGHSARNIYKMSR